MAKTNSAAKSISFIQLTALVPGLRASGKRIVATSGVFDLWHDGHAHYLEDAGQLGDVLIVGVDSDKLVSGRKGPNRPIYDEDLRLKLVTACGAVDYAVVMDDWSILMRLSSPHIIVVSPTTKDADTLSQRKIAEQVGAKLTEVPSRSQTHTSDIIQRIVKTCG